MANTRESLWSDIDQPWDLIVVGGGITGAGILHEAASAGLRAILLEARDFSSGTSSRSGKILHGGIRYVRSRQFRVSRDSVRERENFIRDVPGLVTKQTMYYACQGSDGSSAARLAADLTLYELFAGRIGVRRLPEAEWSAVSPGLTKDRVKAIFQYSEALTDDARLVLRVLEAARDRGGVAINYARVSKLLRDRTGRVIGVQVRDESPEGASRTAEIRAKVVINAAGFQADELREHLGAPSRIRKSRGSHLIFPWERFPIESGICYNHPDDGRIQFVLPWQGVVMAGTTDLDLEGDQEGQDLEPRILAKEMDYILRGLAHTFPETKLGVQDVRATFCGIRPLIRGGAESTSKESRRHALWEENGLITIAGGKMTTYRLMAHSTLLLASKYLKHRGGTRLSIPVVPTMDPGRVPHANPGARTWLAGRYGEAATELVRAAAPGDLESVDGNPTLWAEVRWAIQTGLIVHLDDLMLRHTRLGLTLPEGGTQVFDRIHPLAAAQLGWDQSRWTAEVEAYKRLWRQSYFLPD